MNGERVPLGTERARTFAQGLPASVVALGLVSLLTDVSSEMIYPLLPVFLATTLGAGPAALGIIEGVAESTASLLKVLSGLWSDRLRVRKPLVVAGYGISSVARPLIGLAGSWGGVLGLRFADRIGKGIRTSPRDALIAEVTPRHLLGAAFGFHRSMDHAGAVLGPLLAAALLGAGLSLRGVFLLAAVPSAAVLLVLLLWVREPPRGATTAGVGRTRPERLSPGFRRLLGSTVLFTLGNSTDAFLLLRLGKAGVPAGGIALLWSAHHLVKMASTYWGGRLSDGWGRKPLLLAGWLYYAAVYAGFAFFDSTASLIALFLAYGVYYGLTEPVAGAWAAELSPGGLRGRAYGYYHGAVGAAALPASLLFGLLWNAWGMEAAFLAGSALALAASGVLLGVPGSARTGTD